MKYDADDELQRFGTVKIEATSFTISELVEELVIEPLIYTFANEEEKKLLKSLHGVEPFSVMTITMERIFIDKIFAAESYVRKSNDTHRAFEAAKHIYDLSVMEKYPKIQTLISNEEEVKALLDIRMMEEMNRLDGIPGILPSEFIFFDNIDRYQTIQTAYAIMQRQYVLNSSDRIEFNKACEIMKRLKEILMNNKAWKDYNMK